MIPVIKSSLNENKCYGDKSQNSSYHYVESLAGRGHEGAFWVAKMIISLSG